MAKISPPPPVTQDVSSRTYRDWFYSLYAALGTPGSTLGTMAYQDANSVAITGGAIGGVGISGSTVNTTPIGNTNPSTGKFTSLESTASLRTDTLTGYLYGHDSTGDVTASTTIPWTDITGVPSFVTPSYGAFYQDGLTTLTSGITNVSTTPIPVVSTAAFPPTGYILIESELIAYTGKTSTTFTGITRGMLGTTNVAHSTGISVTDAQGTNSPTTIGQVYFTGTSYSNNVAIDGTDGTKIKFTKAGLYNLQFSVQCLNYTTSADNVTVWFRLNGSDIATSSSIADVPPKHGTAPGAYIMTVNIFQQVAVNDYIQLSWTSDSGNTAIATFPAGTSPVHPVCPAVIFTVNQIA